MGHMPYRAIMGRDTRAVALWLSSERLLAHGMDTFAPCSALPTEAVEALLGVSSDAPRRSLSLLFTGALDAARLEAWTWLVLSPVAPPCYRTVVCGPVASDIVGVPAPHARKLMVIPSDPFTGLRLHRAMTDAWVTGAQLAWPALVPGALVTPVLVCETRPVDYAVLMQLAAADVGACARIVTFGDERAAAERMAAVTPRLLWRSGRMITQVFDERTSEIIASGKPGMVMDALNAGMPGAARIVPRLHRVALGARCKWLTDELAGRVSC